MVASGCLQKPAAVYAGFYFHGMGIEPKSQHMLRPPSATELHPVPKRYIARIWLEAMKTCIEDSGPGSKDACLTLDLLEKPS